MRGAWILVALSCAVSCKRSPVAHDAGVTAVQPAPSEPLWHAEMVEVPAGAFLARLPQCPDPAKCACSGSNAAEGSDAWRSRPLTSATFWVDRAPATCDDYERCVRAGGCQPLEKTSGRQACMLGAAALSLPAAQAYCAWRHGRIPSYTEWQKAARGSDGRVFPDGGEWDPAKACEQPMVASVAQDCLHVSPYGMTYRLKNVFHGEWTSDYACVAPYVAPLVVDEYSERLDSTTATLEAVAARCVMDTQPADGAADTGAHAP